MIDDRTHVKSFCHNLADSIRQAYITVADYVRQYPRLVKIKQYIEDALEKEVMQRKILELVEHEHKIKGVGDMASIGAVLGSMYLCFILFVP